MIRITNIIFGKDLVSIDYNVLRLGGRFNAAKPLLAAAAVYLVGT